MKNNIDVLFNTLLYLTESGLPLAEALLHVENSLGRKLIKAIENGQPFSTALCQLGTDIPAADLARLAAAEFTGDHLGALREICADHKRQQETAHRIANTLVYPCFVLLFLGLLILFLLKFFLPWIESTGMLTAKLDSRAMTARILRSLAVVCAAFTGLIGFAGYRISSIMAARDFWRLLSRLCTASFTLVEALEICEQNIANHKLAGLAADARTMLQAGVEPATALSICAMRKKDVRTDIELAAVTGNYLDSFKRVESRISSRLERSCSLAERFSEPVALLFCGTVFIILSETIFIPLLLATGGLL